MDPKSKIQVPTIIFSDDCSVYGSEKIAFVGIEFFDERDVFAKLLIAERFTNSAKDTESKQRAAFCGANDQTKLISTDGFIANKANVADIYWLP